MAALDVAVGAFRRRLLLVTEPGWEATTPCPGWDVHYLVAHVVGGNRFAALVLSGSSAADAIEDVMVRQQLGPTPIDDFDESTEAQRAAFGAPDALGHVVDHTLGAMTAARFLRMRTFDLALHAWDLATAIGGDPSLPPDLVTHTLGIARSEEPGMGFGIEPTGAADDGGAPLEQLLDLAGRRPLSC